MKKLLLALVTLCLSFPPTASAHAFGTMYTLPIPVWLYLFAGGSTLIVSFFIIGIFLNQTSSHFVYPTRALPKPLSAWLLSKQLKRFFQALFSLLLILTIVSGLFGSNEAYLNINMTLFWIYFVLGLAYLSALFGDFFAAISPLQLLIHGLSTFLGEKMTGILVYPKRLGYLPAFFIYFLFIYQELIAHSTPQLLSILLLIYLFYTIIGSLLFGEIAFFTYFEFFAVFFRLLSKISIFEKRGNKVLLRPPFVGLLSEQPQSTTIVLFILFMLASTAYDGFRSTTVWSKLSLNLLQAYPPQLSAQIYDVIQVIALIIFPIIFILCFIATLVLMKLFVKTKQSLTELTLEFSYSLIPIAFVYNVAHYYTLLLTQGQQLFSLISDPLGIGWNLFGTRDFTPNISIINASFVWHSQVFFIVGGHIAGVYIAHIIALKIFPTHKKALLSQIPMLILMIGYTMAGLWILSQPLSGGG